MILIVTERCAACELIKEMHPGLETRKFRGIAELLKYKKNAPVLLDDEYSVVGAADIIQYLRYHGESKNPEPTS